MAKYCMKCGGQCADQAMQCPRCGAMLGMQNSGNVSQRPSGGGSQFSGGYASPKQMQSMGCDHRRVMVIYIHQNRETIKNGLEI